MYQISLRQILVAILLASLAMTLSLLISSAEYPYGIRRRFDNNDLDLWFLLLIPFCGALCGASLAALSRRTAVRVLLICLGMILSLPVVLLFLARLMTG